MPDLDFLVPSALVEPGLAAELLRDRSLPTLARFVGQADPATTVDVPSRISPGPWQAVVFGLRAGVDLARVNVAELWALRAGLATPSTGRRYVAEPAHFKLANDHLRLDDPSTLVVTLAEAHALATSIEPVLDAAGWRIAPIGPSTVIHWMLTRDDEVPLSAAAIERAIGDNVADWQPRGADDGAHAAAHDSALAWRRCVNEIQMTWFEHPVNVAREANGLATINTLWLSGTGDPAAPLPRYRTIASTLPLLAALPRVADASRSLESFEGFIGPVLREDWSGWRQQLEALEARLAAIAVDQRRGVVDTVTLILCGRTTAKLVVRRRRDAYKLWRRWTRGASSLIATFGEGGST